MDNIQIIQNTLSKVTAESTPAEVKQILKALIQELSSYYNNLDDFYRRVSISAEQKMNIYNGVEASKNTISYAIFKELKQYNTEATIILQEGYVIIDKLREFFTGETITYKIGIPYYSKTYELNLTLSELLKYTRIDFNTKTNDINNLYKLRMRSSKKSLLENYAEYKQEISESGNSGSTLYSSIWHYINDNSDNHGKKYNKGNVYEAYQVYKERQKSNSIPPAHFDADEFDEILTNVRGNIAAATTGGDLGTEQIKFLSSAPSLVTTAQIRRVLASVLSALRTYVKTSNSSDFEQRIKELFLKDGTSLVEEVDKSAFKQANDYIENFIKQQLNLT